MLERAVRDGADIEARRDDGGFDDGGDSPAS